MPKLSRYRPAATTPTYANYAGRHPYDQTPEARLAHEQRIAEQVARVEREEKALRQRQAMPASGTAEEKERRSATLMRWRASPRGQLSTEISRLRASIREIDATHDPAMHARRRAKLAEKLETAMAELAMAEQVP